MAIVHMSKRINKFFQQLEIEEETFTPDLLHFDYDEGKEIFKYDEEVVIALRDFDIEFDLLVEQTGTYTPATHCQPEEFNEEETHVSINNLIVFDTEKGEELRFNREEFTELVQKVKDLIVI